MCEQYTSKDTDLRTHFSNRTLWIEAFGSILLPQLRSAAVVAMFLGMAILVRTSTAADPPIEWMRQFGTTFEERGFDVTADSSGNVYISGYTKGALYGPKPFQENAILAKYDSLGNQLWARQFGIGNDAANGIAADGLGNVYVVGQTAGDLAAPNAGHYDNFVRKYDGSGNVLWTKQWGSGEWDTVNSVAVDVRGNVFVSGDTLDNTGGVNLSDRDAFLTRLDASGNIIWSKKFGTSENDAAERVIVDGVGNAYIVGLTQGSLFGNLDGLSDAFIAKYDELGDVVWSRQFGDGISEFATGVSLDQAGNLYVAGSTSASLGGAFIDVSLRKLDQLGNQVWTRRFGSSARDSGADVVVVGQQVFVTGMASGLIGGPYVGGEDIFIRAYSLTGDANFDYQFGTSGNDGASSIATDGLGSLYLVGQTAGNLAGTNSGNFDIVLAKVFPVPEPHCVHLLLSGIAIVLYRNGVSRGRRRNPQPAREVNFRS